MAGVAARDAAPHPPRPACATRSSTPMPARKAISCWAVISPDVKRLRPEDTCDLSSAGQWVGGVGQVLGLPRPAAICTHLPAGQRPYHRVLFRSACRRQARCASPWHRRPCGLTCQLLLERRALCLILYLEAVKLLDQRAAEVGPEWGVARQQQGPRWWQYRRGGDGAAMQ